MTFRVLLHRKVAKYLKDLHLTVQERIKRDLKTLKDFPATRLDLIKVAGENDVYRIRFGQLRALFKVYNREKIIVVQQNRSEKASLQIIASMLPNRKRIYLPKLGRNSRIRDSTSQNKFNSISGQASAR